MLHIIILNKNYFPTKLNTITPNEKVIILASPDGAIPVSAYKDETLKNMEVKLLPEIKDVNTQEGKGALRIAQAMLIGQITAGINDYNIYSDDNVLLKALAPFTGAKKTSAKKIAASKSMQSKVESAKESDPSKTEDAIKAETHKKVEKKDADNKVSEKEAKSPDEKKSEDKITEAKKGNRPSKVTKAEVKTKPAKLPTQAEVRRVLGAANSGYSKAIMEVIKKSNQITFEMDLRMKLVEAGMEASKCKDIAKTLNEEFGKTLPVSIK